MSFAVCGGRTALNLVLTRADKEKRWCCLGAAEYGVEYCTCWRPVFDERQVKPRTTIEPQTRAKACHDCAYRKASPERERGEDLESLDNFWCHQGIRRPVAFRHPDGRVRPVKDYAKSPDYQPPMVAGVPYRADGKPADRCAGWDAVVARRRAEEAA